METLISFLCGTKYEQLKPEVIHQAKRCLLDWSGVAIGGLKDQASKILINTIKCIGGNEQASIYGTSIRTSVYNAALVHGAMSHVLDYDDTHLLALMHPSAPVIPALLAFGEWKKVSGIQFLLSLVVGIEAETRISMAMGESHYDKGWHSTATMGRFGSAVGVGKMIGLPPALMSRAMGIAGTQSSGIRMVFGTMMKSFHPGKAAADGLLAAMLAKDGYTAPESILDGEKGLGAILSSDFDYDRAFKGLGHEFTIMGISFKPYASCLYTHPLIYGIIQLTREHQIAPKDVRKIECHVSRFCYDAACKKNPRTGLEAKFSAYYCAALALLEGQAGNSLFQDNHVRNKNIKQYMGMIEVTLNPALSDSEAKISIHLNDGHSFTCHVEHPLGDPWNPLDDQTLEEKARDLMALGFSKRRIDQIVNVIWDFESLRDLSKFSKLFRK